MAKKNKPNPEIKTLADLRAKWHQIAEDLLLNKRITKVRWTNVKENAELGWSCSGLRFTLDDGTECDVAMDDEGNGPGTLHTFNPYTGKQEVLCVLTAERE